MGRVEGRSVAQEEKGQGQVGREERKAGLRPELELRFSRRLHSGSPSLLGVMVWVPEAEGPLPSELPYSPPHPTSGFPVVGAIGVGCRRSCPSAFLLTSSSSSPGESKEPPQCGASGGGRGATA